MNLVNIDKVEYGHYVKALPEAKMTLSPNNTLSPTL